MKEKILFIACFIILGYVLNWGCTDRTKEVLNILNKQSQGNILIDSYAVYNDKEINIKYNFKNNDKQKVYIPVAYFHYQFAISNGEVIVSEPINTYLLNTVHMYSKNAKITYMTDMSQITPTQYLPFFIEIPPQKRFTLILRISQKYDDNKIYNNRIIDTVEYKLLTKFAVIKENTFNKIMQVMNLNHDKSKYVLVYDSLLVVSKSTEVVVHQKAYLSKIRINQFQSKVINEMCNYKTDIHCDLYRKN